jgi:transposase-like protein
VLMFYVRYPLSLRNVEDLAHERGVDICHEAVRTWINRFGPWVNRVENSYQPFRRRGRATPRFRRMKSLQKFASVHASFHNHFNQERHLVSRQALKDRSSAALAEWRTVASSAHLGFRRVVPKQRQGAVRLTTPCA